MTKENSERQKNYSNVHPVQDIKVIEPSIKEIIIKGHKDLIKKYKKKAKDVWGGMKIVADKIKRN